MNKNVIIANLQKIIASIEQTIDNVNAICGTYNLSTQKVEKYAAFLNAKLQDENNYKRNAIKSYSEDIVYKRLQSEKTTYKKLIKDVEFDIYTLETEVSCETALNSEKQKDYAMLADSLDISENDEQIYAMMKDLENKMLDIQKYIDEVTSEINNKKKNLVAYEDEIRLIDTKLSNHVENKSFSAIDKDAKTNDEKALLALNYLLAVLKAVDSLEQIENTLFELKLYAGMDNAKFDYVQEKTGYVKTMISQINGTLLEFLDAIKVTDCLNEKENLSKKLTEENNLNESDRKKYEMQVENLKFDISLLQGDISSDEQTILDYTRRCDKLDKDIIRLNINNDGLQDQINELNLRRLYLKDMSDDDINKRVRRLRKKIDLNKKSIEKLIKNKVDLENAIKSIKKIKKNSEILKSDMQIDLSDINDNTSISRYKVDDDKQKLVFINFMIEINGAVKKIVDQDYLQMLDKVSVEEKNNMEIVSFTDYKYVDKITNQQFIDEVKDVMNSMVDSPVKSLNA